MITLINHLFTHGVRIGRMIYQFSLSEVSPISDERTLISCL